MYTPKLALLLPLAHFMIAGVLIGSEDSKYSRLGLEAIERSDAIERQERLHPLLKSQDKIPKEQDFEEIIASEYRPPAAAKGLYGVELPAAALVGWYWHPPYWHPPTSHSLGLLQPLLHRVTLQISAIPKILLLDSLLIAAICGQWWLVGRWFGAREAQGKPVGFQQRLAMAITLAGLVSAISCRAQDEWEFIAFLAAFIAAIAWLVLLLSAVVAMAISVYGFLRGSAQPAA